MPVPDFFTGDAFNTISLTIGVNRIPNMYGRIRELGIFREEGVATRQVAVEEQNGVLNLLPTKAVGGPATLGTQGKRKVRNFGCFHIPHDDVVLPEEIQGIRAFATESSLETQATVMARKLQTMRMKHSITLEHMRASALRGAVLDADGSTLVDLYTEFGITQKSVSFVLSNAATEVLTKILEVKRHIEDNLKGEVMSRFHCLCSPTFFDALVTHAKVKDAYANWQAAAARLGGDMRTGFEHGGVMFEEYRGTASDIDGNVRKFIPDDQAYCFPLGTQTTFVTYFAPADFNETTNTLGLPIYAKQERRKFDRGWDIHTQSNPLPLVLRPELVVKITKG